MNEFALIYSLPHAVDSVVGALNHPKHSQICPISEKLYYGSIKTHKYPTHGMTNAHLTSGDRKSRAGKSCADGEGCGSSESCRFAEYEGNCVLYFNFKVFCFHSFLFQISTTNVFN